MECKTTLLNFERPGNVSFEGSSPLISVVALTGDHLTEIQLIEIVIFQLIETLLIS